MAVNNQNVSRRPNRNAFWSICYPSFFIVADNDGSVPLSCSFRSVDLRSITDDDRGRGDQDPLTGLNLRPLAYGFLDLSVTGQRYRRVDDTRRFTSFLECCRRIDETSKRFPVLAIETVSQYNELSGFVKEMRAIKEYPGEQHARQWRGVHVRT